MSDELAFSDAKEEKVECNLISLIVVNSIDIIRNKYKKESLNQKVESYLNIN